MPTHFCIPGCVYIQYKVYFCFAERNMPKKQTKHSMVDPEATTKVKQKCQFLIPGSKHTTKSHCYHRHLELRKMHPVYQA